MKKNKFFYQKMYLVFIFFLVKYAKYFLSYGSCGNDFNLKQKVKCHLSAVFAKRQKKSNK